MSRVYWGCTVFGCPRGFSGGDTEGSSEQMPRDWSFCPSCGGELVEITTTNEEAKLHASIAGHLDVSDNYAGDDDHYVDTTVEVYGSGPYLGSSKDVIEFLRAFDHKHVEITVREV